MKRLYRSRTDRKVAGICGGMGELYDIDPTLIRLGLVFLGLATAIMPLLVAYIVGAIIIPLGPPPEE
ncbi:MAG TPA: PspC domain-containing protein [Anaerolineae bacterium]|nr:PspC domain-containing protein [Anaerolineae bacterium]